MPKNSAQTFEGDQRAYRAHRAVSQSELKLYARSKQLYYQRIVTGELEQPPTTPSQQFGMDVEAAIERGSVCLPPDTVVIPPEVLNGDGHRRGKAWTEWRDENGHCSHITQAEWDEKSAAIRAALVQIQLHPDANHLCLTPEVERTWHWRILWVCPATGLPRKCELDIAADLPAGPAIIDIKTTRANSPDAFAREIIAYGYDLQAATYLEAVESIAEEEHDYYLVAILNTPPYDVAVYRLDRDSWIEPATKRCHGLLTRLERSQQENDWIWHGGASVTLESPPWARTANRQHDEIEDELYTWEIFE